MMKGLIKKDLILIGQQKHLLFIYLVLAIIMGMSLNSTFLVCYFTMVAILLALSTMSYDSFDNGMAFLMTLPGARKNYAVEKHLLSLIMLVGGLILSFVLQLCSVKMQSLEIDAISLLTQDIIFLPVFILISSIMIPVNLKYGAEKGRLVSFIVIAAIILLGIGGSKLYDYVCEIMGWNTGLTAAFSGGISFVTVAAVFTGISIMVLLLSICISNKIMNNKEF